ncbi:MAG: HD domain-containing protein [Halobacteriaceae archaeon]
MGVEIKESPVSNEEFEEMKEFVRDYLEASIENEEGGGRMRWYPWHSAEYRFNHVRNVVNVATTIAEKEGANIDVVRVAGLFHDIAKLEASQEEHAEVGAEITRQYLENHQNYPEPFIDQVCTAIADHSDEEDLTEYPIETQCVIEGDLLDKVGANGVTLMLLRMGYESRTHMDSAEMVNRVYERGKDKVELLESDAAESIGHQRLKRVRWFLEWLEMEIAGIEIPDEDL